MHADTPTTVNCYLDGAIQKPVDQRGKMGTNPDHVSVVFLLQSLLLYSQLNVSIVPLAIILKALSYGYACMRCSILLAGADGV